MTSVKVVRNFVGVLIAVILAGSMPASITHANIESMTVETGCSSGISNTAVTDLNPGVYDAYVRLGKRGQSGTVTGFSQAYDSTKRYGICDPIGSTTVSGDRWSKLGSMQIDQPRELTIEVASPQFVADLDANRPTVLLVPSTDPVCVPTDECRVHLGSDEGFIRPLGTKLNQDSLKLAVVTDPAQDIVNTVRYYVDDELVYSNDMLKPFDLRYVAFAKQKLSRVVEYESGQQIVLTGSSSSTHTDSFVNFVFRLSQKYPKAFMVVMLTVGIAVGTGIIMALLKLYRRRQSWRINHGFIAQKEPNFAERSVYALVNWKGYRVVKYAIATTASCMLMVVLIIACTQWAAQLVTVDGRSMQKTYSTGDQVLVNKLPKTFADINNGEYVPKRGEVVVVRANFGNVMFDLDDADTPLIIKRVLALPGERVVIKDGKMTIYNKQFPQGFDPDKGSEWEAAMTADNPTESIDIQLATTELFVSGDNRPESIDSRYNGPLLTKEVVGVVSLSF